MTDQSRQASTSRRPIRLIGGPGDGKEVEAYPYAVTIRYCEIGECCGNWLHNAYRDQDYNGQTGVYIGAGEWRYTWRNPITGETKELDPPTAANYGNPDIVRSSHHA